MKSNRQIPSPPKNPQTTTLVIQMRTLEILVGKIQIDTKFQLYFLQVVVVVVVGGRLGQELSKQNTV